MPKVYLTEDSPMQTFRVKKILQEFPGLELHCFDDGLKAFLEIQKNPPDLLLLDLILPGLHGLAVCRLLKFHELHRKLPVLVFSSITEGDLEVQAREAGADAFLRKPFGAEQLLSEIGRITPSILDPTLVKRAEMV